MEVLQLGNIKNTTQIISYMINNNKYFRYKLIKKVFKGYY